MESIYTRHFFYLEKNRSLKNFIGIADSYKILDAQSGQIVAHVEEEQSSLVRLFRLCIPKSLVPSHTEVRTPEGKLLFALKRSPYIFHAKLTITDGAYNLLYKLRTRYSPRLRFVISDAQGVVVAEGRNDLNFSGVTGMDFRVCKPGDSGNLAFLEYSFSRAHAPLDVTINLLGDLVGGRLKVELANSVNETRLSLVAAVAIQLLYRDDENSSIVDDFSTNIDLARDIGKLIH